MMETVNTRLGKLSVEYADHDRRCHGGRETDNVLYCGAFLICGVHRLIDLDYSRNTATVSNEYRATRETYRVFCIFEHELRRQGWNIEYSPIPPVIDSCEGPEDFMYAQ